MKTVTISPLVAALFGLSVIAIAEVAASELLTQTRVQFEVLVVCPP